MNSIIEELKKEKIKIKPEDIDWGYCIPDCAECCGLDVVLHKVEGIAISENLGVPFNELFKKPTYQEEKEGYVEMKKVEDRCILLCDDPHLCSIYEKEFRPDICKTYKRGCWHNIMLAEEIHGRGYDIFGKLKQEWLEELKEDYNQKDWITKASEKIKRIHDVLHYDIAVDKVDEFIIYFDNLKKLTVRGN